MLRTAEAKKEQIPNEFKPATVHVVDVNRKKSALHVLIIKYTQENHPP